MKFSEFQYTRPKLDEIRARCAQLCARLKNAASAQEQIDTYEDFQTLQREIYTETTIATVRHSIDTRDAFYDAENEFADEANPQLEEMFQSVDLALLA